MEIKINQIELASELAAAELFDHWQYSIKILDESDEDEVKYTDEAQIIFDELYDKYMSLINNYKTK